VRIRLIVGILLAVFVVALPATAEAITFDKAMDKLVRQGYRQRIVKKLTGFKSNSMGFRWAGSKADTEAARFMAAGIPSVTSWGRSVAFQENRQHTQYGDYKAIDWRFFTRQTQL